MTDITSKDNAPPASAGPRMEKRSVRVSAVGVAALVVLLIAVVAAFFVYPSLVDVVVWAVLIIFLVILVIVVAYFLIAAIVAVPMYASKGEQVQKGAAYSLDDVKSVKESSSEQPNDGEQNGKQ
ncbi:MAG: hypothetical protein WCQ63_00985 [Methanomethylophilus sp.]|nr:hypothetical protein [Methanomethylophilus sp.]